MNWLNNLLRSPTVDSAPQGTQNRPGPPADIEALRAALAATADEAERARRADELGGALARMLKAPRADDALDVWAAAVSHVADRATALDWMANLVGDGWLGAVAVHGRFAEVRLAAAQRIEDGEVLEHVARLTRAKDKGVFRHCSDLLRQRRQATEQGQRAAQLAAGLRDLLSHAPLSVSTLLDLEQERRALGEGAQSLAECDLLLDQANARLKEESEARRALQACQLDATELVALCATAGWPGSEAFGHWRDRCSTLARTHAGFPGWLAGKPSAQALASSLHQIELRLASLAADGARCQACEQFLAEHAGAPVDAAATAAWNELPKPEHPGIRQALQGRWQGLAALPACVPEPSPAPAPAPVAPPPQARLDVAAVRGWLELLEQALEQGHLAQADDAAKKIRGGVGSGALQGQLAARVQRALARLGELAGWAKWGAEKKREELIAAAEELLGRSHDVDHLAWAVPALREQWKQVSSQPAHAQGESERFDAALEKAFEPVAARRAEEAARRAQARAHKQALCAGWEAEVAAIEWEHADYAAIETRRQQMLDEWRAAPHTGFREERQLRTRLRALTTRIDQRFVEARSAEIQRREQLIASAEALRDEPDVRRSTTQAKSLQERWRKEAGPLRISQADERKLWVRFRLACNALFERRDTERAEQTAQRQQRAQARNALLDAFVAELAGSDPNQIKRALAKFRADLVAAKPGRDEPVEGFDRRARDLQDRAQRQIDALQEQAYRARLQGLEQQAAPAEGVDAEALDAGRKMREALLIDLEIALDLPTPEAFQDARRRRQLERLQSRFRTGGVSQPPAAEELLARWHATAASPDPALDQRVAAVVNKLVAQRAASARK